MRYFSLIYFSPTCANVIRSSMFADLFCHVLIKNIDFADIKNITTEHNFKSNHDFSSEIIKRDSKGTAACFL